MKKAALFVVLAGLGNLGCGTDSAALCGNWVPAIDSVTLEGKVQCAQTKVSLKAEISVDNHKGTCFGDGRFSVESLMAGPHTLHISAPGYVDHLEQIEVRPGQTTSCSVIHLQKK